VQNGKLVKDEDPVEENAVYHTYLRIPGGKGGHLSFVHSFYVINFWIKKKIHVLQHKLTSYKECCQNAGWNDLQVLKFHRDQKAVFEIPGFGSMLRAIGAQIEKTTNHEACRDLSGRRMRDVNNEKE